MNSPCQWFYLCARKATDTEPHPILGDVPICARCKEKVARLQADSGTPYESYNRDDRVEDFYKNLLDAKEAEANDD